MSNPATEDNMISEDSMPTGISTFDSSHKHDKNAIRAELHALSLENLKHIVGCHYPWCKCFHCVELKRRRALHRRYEKEKMNPTNEIYADEIFLSVDPVAKPAMKQELELLEKMEDLS